MEITINDIAENKIPDPSSEEWLSHHEKEVKYFLKRILDNQQYIMSMLEPRALRQAVKNNEDKDLKDKVIDDMYRTSNLHVNL